MSTNEIEAPDVGAELNHDAAVQLDTQIVSLAADAGNRLEELAELLVTARTEYVHEAMKFANWTEYVTDRLRPITNALSADHKRKLIEQLHEAGLSVRAIAEVVDTSKSSVARQVSQSGTRRNSGGGHRGTMPVDMALTRVRSQIHNLNDLPPQCVEKRDQICDLIDELRANIEEAAA